MRWKIARSAVLSATLIGVLMVIWAASAVPSENIQKIKKRTEVTKIPKEITQVIFEKSTFSKPIFFAFPHKVMSLGIGINWFIEHGFLTARKLEKPTMFVKYKLEPTDKLKPHIIHFSTSVGYVVRLASRRLIPVPTPTL